MSMSAPFVWFDLNTTTTTTDGGGGEVGEFYRDLFGWTLGPGAGDYAGWFTDGGQPWAGRETRISRPGEKATFR
jgi:hypothetical protein